MDKNGNRSAQIVGDVDLHEGTNDTPLVTVTFLPQDEGTKEATVVPNNPGTPRIHVFGRHDGLLLHGESSVFVQDATTEDNDVPPDAIDPATGNDAGLDFVDDPVQGARVTTEVTVKNASAGTADHDYEALRAVRIPDCSDVSGDGVTERVVTARRTRHDSIGRRLVDLVFVASGTVRITLESLLDGGTLAETVAVAASATPPSSPSREPRTGE